MKIKLRTFRERLTAPATSLNRAEDLSSILHSGLKHSIFVVTSLKLRVIVSHVLLQIPSCPEGRFMP